MTDELGPASRALLDAARDELAPDGAAIRRMRVKIGATVATTAWTAGGALAAKLAALAVVAAAGVGVLVYRGTGERPTAAPQLELPAQRVDRTAPLPAHEPPPPAPPLIEMDPMPARAPVAAPLPAPATAPRRADLAREVVLVDEAMAALRRRDAQAALAAVRQHAAETLGTGQLAEDAAAIEIEALCQLRDPQAGAKLAAFDARWPESAQRSRLTAKCP